MKRFSTLTTILGAAVLAFASLAIAGHDTETDKNGVILAGYDAVAYFTQGKPVKGSADYTAEYNDAIYQFSSSKNRDLFLADPARYAPQYGGFCAYGMTFGKKIPVNGEAFEVVDGKLYVNKNVRIYKKWAKDIPGHIEEADAEWLEVAYIPASEL